MRKLFMQWSLAALNLAQQYSSWPSFHNTEAFSHLLVYWPEEESVTAASTSAVTFVNDSGSVGSECEVTVKNKKHKGIIAVKG